MVSVPFRLEVQHGMEGPLVANIRVEGRTVRHVVAVRVVARKIDLVVTPRVVELGHMIPGEERAILLQVENRGLLGADVRALHTTGELAVWIRKQTIPPGMTAVVAGRVKLNSRVIGKHVQTAVDLTDDVFVRFSAQVVRPLLPRILAALAATCGILAGLILGTTVGWFFGITVALAGLVAGGVVLATEGQ
jgi:hypothetical protein